jgi:phosphatidylinositol alpha-1,6-mannosyltransferase
VRMKLSQYFDGERTEMTKERLTSRRGRTKQQLGVPRALLRRSQWAVMRRTCDVSPQVRKVSKSASPTVLRVFSEARLYRGLDGLIYTEDRVNGAEAWERYSGCADVVQLVARVGSSSPNAGVGLGSVAVHALPYYQGPVQLLQKLPRLVLSVLGACRGTDLCLFRLPGVAGLLGALWCRLSGRLYAVEVVGDPAEVMRSGVLGRAGRFSAPLAGAVMRSAVAGAATGRYVTASTLQALYPLRPVPEHSYSNVELDGDDVVAAPRSSPRPVKRLLAVGTQDQLYKGHDVLIRALSLLRANGMNLELTLVGDGRYHQQLHALAASCGVADLVTFAGRVVRRDHLRALLLDADLFCMPSRTEGLPRALIEAMAHAVPSIGSSVGGIPELLDVDLLVSPDDPAALADLIKRAVEGELNLVEVSARLWRRAQQFGSPDHGQGIAAWMEQLRGLLASAT